MEEEFINGMIFRKKSVHQRQDKAMRFIGARISVYKISKRDYELIDHLTSNHRIITSYPYNSGLSDDIILVLERKI